MTTAMRRIAGAAAAVLTLPVLLLGVVVQEAHPAAGIVTLLVLSAAVQLVGAARRFSRVHEIGPFCAGSNSVDPAQKGPARWTQGGAGHPAGDPAGSRGAHS